MATLLEKCYNIKNDKETNLKPENLKAGITCLGVTGTLTAGAAEPQGDFSATFISNKPYDNGSLVKIVYTNEQDKLTEIPVPAPFDGRFENYKDITISSYGTNANITLDTVFTADKVYRAVNTEGYFYTYKVPEDKQDICTLQDGLHITPEVESEMMLAGEIAEPPQVNVIGDYVHVGWETDRGVFAFPAKVQSTESEIRPVLVNPEENSFLTFTFIPGDSGVSDNIGSGASFDDGNVSYADGLIGVVGERAENEWEGIFGWNSLTYTFDMEDAHQPSIVEVLGKSMTYAFGDVAIVDAETEEDVEYIDYMGYLDLSKYEHGKTYKISGSFTAY